MLLCCINFPVQSIVPSHINYVSIVPVIIFKQLQFSKLKKNIFAITLLLQICCYVCNK